VIPWSAIDGRISETLGAAFVARRRTAVSGGCINSAYVLAGDDVRYFIKLNQAERLAMFAAEAAGLAEIRRAHVVRAPEPVCWDAVGDTAFLVLEHLALRPLNEQAFEQLGGALAELHRWSAPRFGWCQDNTIGATLQANNPSASWLEFYRERRLLWQLRLAGGKGYRRLQHKGERLVSILATLLADHRPVPSLLHGDLWYGNAAMDSNGLPVVFDPAVYYGDRETDLAMSELFGGFSPRFYAAYFEAWPAEAGYAARRPLYHLYHLLNHANLFGGSYVAQAEDLIDRLVSSA
jgi:fructosamine-3-kinase